MTIEENKAAFKPATGNRISYTNSFFRLSNRQMGDSGKTSRVDRFGRERPLIIARSRHSLGERPDPGPTKPARFARSESQGCRK